MAAIWSEQPKAQLEAACTNKYDSVAGLRLTMRQELTQRLGLLATDSAAQVDHYVTKRCSALGLAPDQDRPEEALSVGESETLDDVEVTVTKFVTVHPKDPLDGFDYVGAYVTFTNNSDGPKEVLADAQLRLENPYVATVEPITTTLELREGGHVPIGAFRPGSTVKGWVAWAVPKDSELLKSVGIYYTAMSTDEAVWWVSYFKRK
jgi:hypothetical protein